jgi:hypothetical protein
MVSKQDELDVQVLIDVEYTGHGKEDSKSAGCAFCWIERVAGSCNV